MKNLFYLACISLLLIGSCGKEDTNTTTPLTNDQILTKVKSWKFSRARSVVNGQPSLYERGLEADPFDLWFFEFNSDGTGLLSDGNGSLWPISYTWLNSEQTKLNVTVKQNTTYQVLWENFKITEQKMSYTEFIDQAERLSLSVMELVPLK